MFKLEKRVINIVNCTNPELSLSDRIVYSVILYGDDNDWQFDRAKIAQLGGLDWETVDRSLNKLRDVGLVHGLSPLPLTDKTRCWFQTMSKADGSQSIFRQLASWKYYVRKAKCGTSRATVAILSYLIHRHNTNYHPKYYTFQLIANDVGVERHQCANIFNKFNHLFQLENGKVKIDFSEINHEWFADLFTEKAKEEVDIITQRSIEIQKDDQKDNMNQREYELITENSIAIGMKVKILTGELLMSDIDYWWNEIIGRDKAELKAKCLPTMELLKNKAELQNYVMALKVSLNSVNITT